MTGEILHRGFSPVIKVQQQRKPALVVNKN